jgi:hypothetical protein
MLALHIKGSPGSIGAGDRKHGGHPHAARTLGTPHPNGDVSEPFGELERIPRQIRRMIDRTFGGYAFDSGPSLGWTPLVDVVETDDGYVIEAEVPGVKREDVDVELIGNGSRSAASPGSASARARFASRRAGSAASNIASRCPTGSSGTGSRRGSPTGSSPFASRSPSAHSAGESRSIADAATAWSAGRPAGAPRIHRGDVRRRPHSSPMTSPDHTPIIGG